ncbi:hypothetical protein GRS48_00295 [Halorubrum sp. JWXQ-INN 858]|uniref:hypothetical protein n=1 Tax=Halorubrum sp. JWXQ-INN 858 TaxID=2690782 RepID=UPI0013578D05|nr:hypothetical protein [Halorubrum sp. JWXQ-INN 858]MWV63275.1 hypothetical protein [Halorubrum sp. JWXQ-INN 858]
MKRREYIILGGASVSAAVSGCLGSLGPGRRDKPWVTLSLFSSDIIRKFHSEQYLEIHPSQANVEGRNLPPENQEHHISVDVTVLAQYGVDLENLSVEPTQERERPPDYSPEVTRWTGRLPEEPNTDIDTVEMADGMIDLVLTTPENITQADPIGLNLTGFDCIDVEAMTTASYDVQSSDDHVNPSQHEFQVFDPQQLPPTLYPRGMMENSDTQVLTIDWLVPETEEVVMEIDTSTMDEYGTIRGPVIEEKVRGGVLKTATINGSTVSMRLLPDSDSDFASVQVRLNGVEIRNTAEGLLYQMTVEGDTHETVETKPFDIETEPTPE